MAMTMPTSAKPSHETSEKAKITVSFLVDAICPKLTLIRCFWLMKSYQHCMHSASLKTYFSLRIYAVMGATELTDMQNALPSSGLACKLLRLTFGAFPSKQSTFQVLSINTV